MANLPFPGKPAPSEIINIVDILSSREDGQKTLREMGQRVVFDTGYDDLSRKKWKEHVARSIKVFSSFKDTPNLPWDNAANVNLPMLAVACLQFQARAFDALIPPKGVVSAYPTGEEDIKKADRVQKWMNYELLYKMPDFEEGMDKTLLQLPVIGCVFRKTYYDPYLKCNRSVYCSAEDVIVPYTTRVSIAAEKVPGVIVIRDGDLVAALHRHWDEADKAIRLVKATFTRNDPPVDNATIFDHLVKNSPAERRAAEGGDPAAYAGPPLQVFEQIYHDSYMAHATMETHSADAAFENGKLTVWAGTQTPFPVKNQIMQALKLPADKVRVITPYVGGGFGGKSASRQAVEAARLAQVSGKPVRVVWTREEEFFYDTLTTTGTGTSTSTSSRRGGSRTGSSATTSTSGSGGSPT